MYKFYQIAFLGALLCLSSWGTARATEVSAPQFKAFGGSFSTDSSTAGPSGYVREGAAITGFEAGVSARGAAKCSGSAWSSENVSGICYDAGTHKACNNCGECNEVSWNTIYASMSIGETVNCGGDYCFIEADGKVGKTPHDHMFFASPGGDGFVDFKKCGTLSWMSRIGGEDKSLMIPTKCDDYGQFIGHHPPDVIRIEGACRPASFVLCPQGPPSATAPPDREKCN